MPGRKPYPVTAMECAIASRISYESVTHHRKKNGCPKSSVGEFCKWLEHWTSTKENSRIESAAKALDKRKIAQERQKAPELRAHKRVIEKASYYRNHERSKALARARRKKQRATPLGKIKKALSQRLYDICSERRIVKDVRAIELLGTTVERFREFIESQFRPGMAWGNYGKWHIDHVIPCSSFDISDPAQRRACFHFTNLRPLWRIANIRKGSRITIRAHQPPLLLSYAEV